MSAERPGGEAAMTTPPRGTGENLLPECCGRHGTSQSYYCGLCPLDEALAEYVGNPAQRRIVLDRLTTLRARLAAAEREWAATVNAAKFDAETHAKDLISERRAGAEAALRWAKDNPVDRAPFNHDEREGYVVRALATLFPEAPDAHE